MSIIGVPVIIFPIIFKLKVNPRNNIQEGTGTSSVLLNLFNL